MTQTIFLIIHIAAGSIALAAGIPAMLAKKGSALHSNSGRVYLYCMYVVGFTALILSFINPSPFLFSIGLFALYLAFGGWQSIRFWTLRKPMLLSWREKLPHVLAWVTSIFMLAQPVADMVDRKMFYVPVLSVFGLVMFILSSRTLRTMYVSKEIQVKDRSYLFRHINYMGGSYISAFTAFAVTNLAFGPSWLPWLMPTLIGTLIITLANIKWQKKIKPKATKAALLILILTAMSGQIQAKDQQAMITGQTVDQEMQPIPYVSIGLPGSSIGTVSNEEGQFILDASELKPNDSILFSCLGYTPVWKTQKALSPGARIRLISQSTSLPEVVVRPGKLRAKSLGMTKSNAFMTTNLAISKKPSMNLGASIGKKFFPGSKPFYLDSFAFYLQYNTFDTVVFRVQVYEAEWGKPGKTLLPQGKVFSLVGVKKGWVKVDLSSYQLALEDNFIVAVEWVGQSVKGNYLGLPIKMPVPGSEHFYRYGSQNKWKRFVSMSTSMYVTGKQ